MIGYYNLNMIELEICFERAKKMSQRYIGIKIQMEGFPLPEVIINEAPNFDNKLAYYKKAYNEDLTLKTFNGIKIIKFTYGNSFAELEKRLMANI